jgi:hypothetical protein
MQRHAARKTGESRTIQDDGCNAARCSTCDRVRLSKPLLRTGCIEHREKTKYRASPPNGATGKAAACIGSAARTAQCHQQEDAGLARGGRKLVGGLIAGFRCVKEQFSLPLRNVVVVESVRRWVSRRLFAQRQGKRLHHSNSLLGHPSQAVTSRHRYRTRLQSNGPWAIGLPVSFTVTE